MHVSGRVAVQREHLFIAEFVVAGPVLRQVGVLQSGDPDCLGDLFALRHGELGTVRLAVVVFLDNSQRLAHAFVDQPFQPDRIARPRFVRFSIFAQHGSESDVMQRNALVAPQPRGREQFVEVLGLPMIDNVENRVRIPTLDAVPDGRQIGRGVKKCSIPLADDHRRVEPVEEDAHGAVAFPRQSAALHIGDHVGQLAVVEALPELLVEGHAKPLVDRMDFPQAVRHEFAPQP